MKDRTNKTFVAEAREHCALLIKNTHAGRWLDEALCRLEEAGKLSAERRRVLAEMIELRSGDCVGCGGWDAETKDCDRDDCELQRLSRLGRREL